jgi:NAD-dependent deacetylase
MDQEFYELVKNALPNKSHLALAQIEKSGKLLAVITQNVDGLHQRAGNSADKVIEIHGSIFTVSCFLCYKKYSRQEIYLRVKGGVAVPYCSFCYGILKPDTVLFGQPIPQEVSARALMAALQSDLFIVIGSSLLVQPASYLVIKAKEAKAKIIIINLTSTPYDIYADLVIYNNADFAVSQIMSRLQ